MSDDNNRNDIDDFFDQFDRIDTDDNEASDSSDPEIPKPSDFETSKSSGSMAQEPLDPGEQPIIANRLERNQAKKSNSLFNSQKNGNKTKTDPVEKADRASMGTGHDMQADVTPHAEDAAHTDIDMNKELSKQDRKSKRESKKENRKEKKRTKKGGGKNGKKKSSKKKVVLRIILGVIIALFLAGAAFVGYIVATTPNVDYNNIYDLLNETSTLYDEEGNVIETIYLGDGKRTRVDYDEMPEDLINAFVAIEDKTFWDHHGFNFVRIIGAIKDSIFGGDRISGTSTITQQLARNIWLAETKSERSLTRKAREAYYAFQLERHLSKEQIIETYLNTIALGNHSYGVQAASEAYFSKDVQDIDLVQAAELACLPQAPSKYALIKTIAKDEVLVNDPNLVYLGDVNAYMYNDAVDDRYQLVLKFMKEQEYIDDAEYQEASAADLKESLNPNVDEQEDTAAYFVDFTINALAEDLMEEFNIDSLDEAKQKVYSSGYEIHTTLNLRMQKIVEEEFKNNQNFPEATSFRYDSSSNILGDSGILLYNYGNYFNSEGVFTLSPDEYELQANGNILLKKDMRLNFYKTKVEGKTDYSVEFKDMYLVEEGVFYSIKGGVISIPQEYKKRDSNGNVVVSKKFMEEHPEVFSINEYGISITPSYYVLKQKVVQPQAAMVVMEHESGAIKAMVGGRNIEGRMLYNRSTEPRQPGSAIKPMGVYAPALQMGADGEKIQGGEDIYGTHWTAGSVIDDAPMYVGGRTWPKNWYSGYHGMQTMRKSVEQSVNVNAVKVLVNIGEERSAAFLKKLGVTTLVEEGDVNDLNSAALALGGMTTGVSPLEMAAGYSTFPNQGEYTEPVPYTTIEKNGDMILEKNPDSEQVMDPGVAFIMNDILRTTVTSGIATRANIGSQPVAGKTGTTTDNYDAWFVGNTPQYAASLWIGNDVNIELSEGSMAAARLWSNIMRQVCEGLERGSFPSRPENVYSKTIAAPQGTSSSDETGLSSLNVESRSEYFIRGTSPPNASFSSGTEVYICPDSGYLATGECPNPTPRMYSDDDPAPVYYCYIHNSDHSRWPPPPGYRKTEPDPEQPENPTDPAINPSGGSITSGSIGLRWYIGQSGYNNHNSAAANNTVTAGLSSLHDSYIFRTNIFDDIKRSLTAKVSDNTHFHMR